MVFRFVLLTHIIEIMYNEDLKITKKKKRPFRWYALLWLWVSFLFVCFVLFCFFFFIIDRLGKIPFFCQNEHYHWLTKECTLNWNMASSERRQKTLCCQNIWSLYEIRPTLSRSYLLNVLRTSCRWKDTFDYGSGITLHLVRDTTLCDIKN